jgi:hypothetical protein
MPFAVEFDPTYKAIAACCRSLGLSAKRADDLFRASQVINDVWSLIVSAEIIICDCTYKNPNVFYELGIAHTLGKRVVLITQNADDIPFDLRQWRHLVYQADAETLFDDLQKYLKEEADLTSPLSHARGDSSTK